LIGNTTKGMQVGLDGNP